MQNTSTEQFPHHVFNEKSKTGIQKLWGYLISWFNKQVLAKSLKLYFSTIMVYFHYAISHCS